MNTIYLLVLYFVIGTHSYNPYTKLSIINDSTLDQPYNIETILNISIKDFIETLSAKPVSKSGPINIYETVNIHYEARQKIVNILSIFETYNPLEWIPNILNEIYEFIKQYNLQSFQISDEYEKECIRLIDEIYSADIFLDWRSIDDIDNTKKEIEEIKEYSASLKKETKTSVLQKTLAAVTLAVSSPITRDFTTPYVYMVDAGIDIMNLISSADKQVDNTGKQLLDQKTQKISKEMKHQLNEKLYVFSKFYCSNAFHFQIVMKDHQLIVEGDKMNYEWMIELINVIDSNIDMQILYVGKSEDIENYAKETVIQSLISTKQRFVVLKTVLHTISDFVGFIAHSHLSKKIRNPTTKSWNLIKEFFNEKKREFENLLVKLKQTFPKKEEQLQKNKEIMSEIYKYQQWDQELIMIQYRMENQQTEFDYKMTVENIESYWESTKILYNGYFRYVSNNSDFFGETLEYSLKKMVISIGKGPFGLIKGIGELGKQLIWFMIVNPGGWVVSIVLLIIGLCSIGGFLYMIRIIIWIFTKCIKNIYAIIEYIFTKARSLD